MNRRQCPEDHLIRPQEDESKKDLDIDASDGEEMGKDGDEKDETAEVVKGVEVGGEEQEKAEPVRVVRSPSTPSIVERAAHEATHWPYRSWCDPCVKSRGLGQQHRSVSGDDAESTVPRAVMDYGFIKEDQTTIEDDHGKTTAARVCMTILVMAETLCNSVWAYAIEGKGGVSADWLAPKIVEDLGTVGLTQERIIAKSDQEASIVQLQHEIAKLRKGVGTGIENSRVGDSDSNGMIERGIREVKGMTRTLRCHLEEKLNKDIKLTDPIVPWMVRHAAYIITRCRIGPDGKTAMQKLKGRRVVTPMLPFAESVLFKLPKVPSMPGDFQSRFEQGIWLGCLVRSGEHIVGTGKGVYTVSQVTRRPEDKKWSSELVDNLKGVPQEPVPGSGSSKMHAYAKPKDDAAVQAPKFEPRKVDEIPEVRAFYIHKRDLDAHGGTPGCPGCRALLTVGSRHRAKHTVECRKRLEELLMKTEEGARRLGRVSEREERLSREIAEQGEVIMGKEAEDGPAPEASGSGISDDERKQGLAEARQKDSERADDAMNGEVDTRVPKTPPGSPTPGTPPCFSPGSDEENKMAIDGDEQPVLQEAPGAPHDVRVPLADRPAAVKRAHEEDATHEEQAKWQTIEVEAKSIDVEQAEDEVDKVFADFLSWHPGQRPGVKGTSSGKTITPGSSRSESQVDVNACDKEESIKRTAKHPGPKLRRNEIEKNELKWQDIGSGTFARTFIGVKKLFTTTRGGPPLCDVHRRTIWSITTGKVIDDCFVDDVPDAILYRELLEEDDIRVELVMKGALAMYERQGADVVEMFSQPRIAQEATAKRYGGTQLVPGWSLDLTRLDPKTGRAWDLSNPKVQSRVIKMVAEGKPLFVIGSPPCTAFSSMQNLSAHKRDPKVINEERRRGERHLNFCIKVYLQQVKAGRFFVHEHPDAASSWKIEGMIELMMMAGVDAARVDMCQFGLTIIEKGEEKLARKRTKIVSNSAEVLKRVETRCPNERKGSGHHQHANLEDGRTKLAQVYPKRFCQAVCEGIAAQKRLRALGLEAKPVMTEEEMVEALDQLGVDREGDEANEMLHEEDLRVAFDDQSGEPLDLELVKKARQEEIRYFKERGVYEKVNLDECWKETGRGPIGVKWVDINKGDSKCPNYRSRLVAMEFKTDERPEWYAATPPSECLKILLSMLASDPRKKMLYADVSRAYFYARAARPVYVKLPDEDRLAGDSSRCGRLKVSMYGTRDAALNWASEYGETLKAAGYRQGRTNPCLFWHKDKKVTVMVHGDDFVAIGNDEDLMETQRTLSEKYKIKTEKLGGQKGDAKEIRVLNKVIRHTDEGLELEADPRHAEIVMRDLDVSGSKVCKTPGAKTEPRKQSKDSSEEEAAEEEGEAMEPKDATKYRAVVARLNYMAADRPDLQFAVKEVARHMASPHTGHWHALKRIGQYLKGRPRLILRYYWQSKISTVATYTDSDWAGCKKTGKSTSGGIVTIGGHVIKSYARQQRTVALSSAEAELHAMVAASAETIGIVSLCRDMGVEMTGEVYADSSAALGIAQRSGAGKVRHLRVQALWVQEVRSTGRLGYHKVLGSRNPADILTKHVPAELLKVHLETIGAEIRDGRAETAPAVNAVEPWTISWLEEDGGEKRVRFLKVVEVRKIPAVGRGRSTREAKKTKAARRGASVPGGVELQSSPSSARSVSRASRPSWNDMTDEEELERDLAASRKRGESSG